MTEEIKKTSEQKTKRERSTAYPAVSLREAVELSEKLIESYSKSPFSRELAVQGIGYKTITGTSAPKIAALVHYGLLERGASTYKNSELSGRITDFKSEEDRKSAIVEAVMNPKLFNSLIQDYSNKAIPSLLKNILISQYKIGRGVADNVSKTFRDSVEFAGIYVNGVVVDVSTILNEGEKTEDPKDELGTGLPRHKEKGQIGNAKTKDARHDTFSGMQSVTLPSGVTISYQPDLAYSFAIGEFGKEIAALNKAIENARTKDKKPEQEGGETNTSPVE